MIPRNTVLALTVMAACLPAAAPRHEQLEKLFADYNENTLRENPEIATLRGRMEYNDRWTDWSHGAIDRRSEQRRQFIERVQPFLKLALSDQDRISARLLEYLLERRTDTEALDVYLLRVGQMTGLHTNVFRTVHLMPRNGDVLFHIGGYSGQAGDDVLVVPHADCST